MFFQIDDVGVAPPTPTPMNPGDLNVETTNDDKDEDERKDASESQKDSESDISNAEMDGKVWFQIQSFSCKTSLNF